MSYVLVDNFSAGVDQTRPIHVGQNGALWEGVNGHIGRGGDFEKRKAFVETYALPAGTFGLAHANGVAYVFGSGAAPAGMPPEIVYRQLASPSASPMVEVLSHSVFDGKLYVVAKYEDGSIHHFYNFVRVADWDGGANLPFEKGTVVFTLKNKVYSCAKNILFYSGVNTPAGWDYATSGGDVGAGFLNMSNHQQGAELLTGLGAFQDRLAVFAETVTQIWYVTNDDAANTPAQMIPETGTRSPRSVRSYADIDLFYLSDTGIRSLRARSTTNTAGVQDVGTPIDPVVQAYLDTLTDAQIARACSAVDPRDARFWLAVGERIFVFSYFPSKKVSAWTWYEPGFGVDELMVFRKRMWLRSGNKVYLYGGATGNAYDSCRVTVQLPFISNSRPGHYKAISGVDISSVGEWEARVLVDPNNLTQYIDFGRLSGVTWLQEDTSGLGFFTHMAPRFVSEAPGPASLSQIGIHFGQANTEQN